MEERKVRRAAKEARAGSQPSTDSKTEAEKLTQVRSPFQPESDTKYPWTGKGEVRVSPFSEERLEEDVLRHIEEERRRREELAKPREMAKGAPQGSTQQANSPSQAQVHSN